MQLFFAHPGGKMVELKTSPIWFLRNFCPWTLGRILFSCAHFCTFFHAYKCRGIVVNREKRNSLLGWMLILCTSRLVGSTCLPLSLPTPCTVRCDPAETQETVLLPSHFAVTPPTSECIWLGRKGFVGINNLHNSSSEMSTAREKDAWGQILIDFTGKALP